MSEQTTECGHGNSSAAGENRYCLTCPHVWPIASDPDGYEAALTAQPVAKAPNWYVDHFQPFGYTVERLEQAWARLSDPARDSYRALLNASLRERRNEHGARPCGHPEDLCPSPGCCLDCGLELGDHE